MTEPNDKGNVKKTIWIPEELDRAVKQAAKMERETFSEFVRQAILSRLIVIDFVHKIKKEIRVEKRREKAARGKDSADE